MSRCVCVAPRERPPRCRTDISVVKCSAKPCAGIVVLRFAHVHVESHRRHEAAAVLVVRHGDLSVSGRREHFVRRNVPAVADTVGHVAIKIQERWRDAARGGRRTRRGRCWPHPSSVESTSVPSTSQSTAEDSGGTRRWMGRIRWLEDGAAISGSVSQSSRAVPDTIIVASSASSAPPAISARQCLFAEPRPGEARETRRVRCAALWQ